MLRERFIAIQAYLKKQNKKSKINNLTLHLKQLEKEEIRAEIMKKKQRRL